MDEAIAGEKGIFGTLVSVGLSIKGGLESDITALGLSAELPNGYVYDGFVSESKPIAEPKLGAQGHIEFVWCDIPKIPGALVYRIKAEAGESQKAGTDIPGIRHSLKYRTFADELAFDEQ